MCGKLHVTSKRLTKPKKISFDDSQTITEVRKEPLELLKSQSNLLAM